MSESGTAVSGETARPATSSVTTMSGKTTPASVNLSVTSINTPVQANRSHGNSLPVSSGIVTPILSQEGLSTLLQSYISSQLCQASRNSQLTSAASARTSAAMPQPRFQPCSASSQSHTSVSNPLVTSHVNKCSVPTSRKVNFNVKIINPVKKKEFETYVLRDVSKDHISTPTLLRKELLQQFGESLVSSAEDFAVGYYRGCCKLSICSPADTEEVWKCACKGENITLWCNGPKQTRIEIGSDSEEDLPKQRKRQKRCALDEKNRRVEKLASSLREKHGDTFTKIQYRLWAEMVDVGTHKYVYDLFNFEKLALCNI